MPIDNMAVPLTLEGSALWKRAKRGTLGLKSLMARILVSWCNGSEEAWLSSFQFFTWGSHDLLGLSG